VIDSRIGSDPTQRRSPARCPMATTSRIFPTFLRKHRQPSVGMTGCAVCGNRDSMVSIRGC